MNNAMPSEEIEVNRRSLSDLMDSLLVVADAPLD